MVSMTNDQAGRMIGNLAGMNYYLVRGTLMISRSGAAKKNTFFKTAIIKFAVSEWLKKIRRKIFFSGFSETTQANFIWALIF